LKSLDSGAEIALVAALVERGGAISDRAYISPQASSSRLE